MKLLIATRNRGKRRELAELLAPLGLALVDLNDVAVADEPEETGATFLDNARLKAAYYAERAQLPTLADDSGLCVAALQDRPGVFSARYAGPQATDADNNAKLLREMAGVADRRARFVCVVVCRRPDGAEIHAIGEAHGVLLSAPRGASGFGYDPLFFVPELGATFAELGSARKHAVSHRGQAFRRIAGSLPAFLAAAK
jgi:XTP/dITP diphosphohydrolase